MDLRVAENRIANSSALSSDPDNEVLAPRLDNLADRLQQWIDQQALQDRERAYKQFMQGRMGEAFAEWQRLQASAPVIHETDLTEG